MKTSAFRFDLPFNKTQKNPFQLFILTVLALVLGAGAPVDVGGIGC